MATTKAQRGAVLAGVTSIGMVVGIMADPSQHGLPPLTDIVGAIVLSPLLVTCMGPMVASASGRCTSGSRTRGVQKAKHWALLCAGVLTSVGFYGIMTRFAGVMSA